MGAPGTSWAGGCISRHWVWTRGPRQLVPPLPHALASLEGHGFHSKAHHTTAVFRRALLRYSVNKMWGFVVSFFPVPGLVPGLNVPWWILTSQLFSSSHHPAFCYHRSHCTSVSWRSGSPDLTARAGLPALTCWAFISAVRGFRTWRAHCGIPTPPLGPAPSQPSTAPSGGVHPPTDIHTHSSGVSLSQG